MELKVSNLTKSFGDNHVLKRISLAASSGKALGILGRNGAGKTTAIRIIMGVFPPDSGEITLDGKPLNRDAVSIGYLPEERGLYPKKQILEQLVYFGILKGMGKKSATESALHWLSRLDMIDHKTHRLDTLSKGNQQKIQLVAALISNPDIVILDEPFSGLDPVNAVLLKDVVRELLTQNKIVLFSSHQMNYIEEFCDNIVILNAGKIVLSGSTSEIKRSYDRSKIIVSAPDIEKIKSVLMYDCVIEDGKLIVTLKNEGDKSILLKNLAASELDIDEIKVYEPTLEDIFVEHTSCAVNTEDKVI